MGPFAANSFGLLLSLGQIAVIPSRPATPAPAKRERKKPPLRNRLLPDFKPAHQNTLQQSFLKTSNAFTLLILELVWSFLTSGSSIMIYQGRYMNSQPDNS
jgi:hypothetical protein